MSLASQFSSGHPSKSITLSDAKWWTAFGDPVLNDIVKLGLQQNLDIRRAVARIKQAEGLSAAAGYPISGSEAAQEVLEIALRDFATGKMDFFQVQDAERPALFAETALATDRRNMAIDFVTLNVALGGTYKPNPGIS